MPSEEKIKFLIVFNNGLKILQWTEKKKLFKISSCPKTRQIFLFCHRIAESKACRMPIENLAKCFAPTIVGYSAEVLPDHAVLSETAQQAKVMEYLLKLPAGYWKSFIHVQQTHASGKLQQTPSTDSLLRTRGAGGGGLFGSPSSK